MNVGSIGSTSTYSFLDRLVMNSMNRSSQSQSAQGSTADFAAKIIEREDKDGDGKISTQESRVDSDRFNEIDTDGDGLITSEELQASAKSRENDQLSKGMMSMQSMGGMQGMGGGMQGVGGMQGPPPGGPPSASEIASSVMESADSDSDGVLSVNETGLDSTDFNTLDTDGDGKVTTDELTAGIKARQSEMDSERTAAMQQTSSSSSDTSSMYDTLFETLARGEASSAYNQSNNWLYEALQSSSQMFTTVA